MKFFKQKTSILLNSTLVLSLLSSNSIATELIICPTDKNISNIKSERLISPNGQGSQFYFRVEDGTKEVIINEVPRESKISEDITTLIKIGTTIVDFPSLLAKEATRKPRKECILYKQSFKRAFVEIKTMDETNSSIVYNFITGPTENIYLSADMPITSINELYYDTQTDTLSKREQPASFYLGINYKIGDLFIDYPVDEFYNNISLKALAKISEKPTESIGFGLGYHITDGIEIFVAKLWTQDNRNVEGDNLGRTSTLTYGVSFNLNKGLDWIRNIY